MKEFFVSHNFSMKSRALIEQANVIMREYLLQQYTLTLRQLYYQMVARDFIENTVNSYKRLGSILVDARLAGLVDWAMEDRTRNLYVQPHWENPAEIIESAAASFRLDKWEGQAVCPEIWVEKEALAGIVQRVAQANDCGYMACRGYMSITEMYEAAQRIRQRRKKAGQETIIIYLGDHDPSGLDMSENDIVRRFEVFMDKYNEGSPKINRVALNWDQIEAFSPPPNPAKETDSRFEGYRAKYNTEESWELDALDPATLSAIIQDAIDEVKDPDMYSDIEEKQEKEREILTKASEQWERVARYLTRPSRNGKGSHGDL